MWMRNYDDGISNGSVLAMALVFRWFVVIHFIFSDSDCLVVILCNHFFCKFSSSYSNWCYSYRSRRFSLRRRCWFVRISSSWRMRVTFSSTPNTRTDTSAAASSRTWSFSFYVVAQKHYSGQHQQKLISPFNVLFLHFPHCITLKQQWRRTNLLKSSMLSCKRFKLLSSEPYSHILENDWNQWRCKVSLLMCNGFLLVELKPD